MNAATNYLPSFWGTILFISTILIAIMKTWKNIQYPPFPLPQRSNMLAQSCGIGHFLRKARNRRLKNKNIRAARKQFNSIRNETWPQTVNNTQFRWNLKFRNDNQCKGSKTAALEFLYKTFLSSNQQPTDRKTSQKLHLEFRKSYLILMKATHQGTRCILYQVYA